MLNCKKPKCMTGCPVEINIPAFIAQVAEGNIEEAYKIISESSSLPAVCGRVCPQETQCEGSCILGIKGEPVAIGKLERFVGDWNIARGGGEASQERSSGGRDPQHPPRRTTQDHRRVLAQRHPVVERDGAPGGQARRGRGVVHPFSMAAADFSNTIGGCLQRRNWVPWNWGP